MSFKKHFAFKGTDTIFLAFLLQCKSKAYVPEPRKPKVCRSSGII